jgi:hypothetical protein
MSSRLAAAQALQAILQSLQNGSSALYGLVKIGAVYDPTGYSAWAEITHLEGKGGPAGSGGSQVGWRIQESITYLIRSWFGPYEPNDSTAETAKLTAQDIVLPALRTHYQLPQAGNPSQAVAGIFRVLVEAPDRSGPPIRFPNGSTYLPWDVRVLVDQQYSLLLATP